MTTTNRVDSGANRAVAVLVTKPPFDGTCSNERHAQFSLFPVSEGHVPRLRRPYVSAGRFDTDAVQARREFVEVRPTVRCRFRGRFPRLSQGFVYKERFSPWRRQRRETNNRSPNGTTAIGINHPNCQLGRSSDYWWVTAD